MGHLTTQHIEKVCVAKVPLIHVKTMSDEEAGPSWYEPPPKRERHIEPSAPSKEIVEEWFASLAKEEYDNVDYWEIFPFLPNELVHKILNYAARARSHDRLKKGWKDIHHAFTPCSVCGALLKCDVGPDGEIITTGKLDLILWRCARLPRGSLIHLNCFPST